MNKIIYRIVIMCFAVVLLVTGAYIGLRISDNAVAKENVLPEPIDTVDETTTVVSIYKSEDKDIEVTYEDYYINCKETITNKNIEFGTTKEKIKEKVDKEYKLVEETENSIIFRKEIDSNCPNHFKLLLEKGYVIIYQIVDDEISTIYKNTEIPESNIREELISELKKGIMVNTLEDLNSYIEDIES
ncbi:MAG: hypothetical protein PHD15_02470 [Clostridia bacterium]|nr:hypothetical protein [Clostridia bacterium]MDD4386611.1 hypothetical protein [Clostridia bacterium]